MRISTDWDSAETAWLTSNWTDLAPMSMLVTVSADALSFDDGYERIQLG